MHKVIITDVPSKKNGSTNTFDTHNEYNFSSNGPLSTYICKVNNLAEKKPKGPLVAFIDKKFKFFNGRYHPWYVWLSEGNILESRAKKRIEEQGRPADYVESSDEDSDDDFSVDFKENPTVVKFKYPSNIQKGRVPSFKHFHVQVLN